MVPLAEDRCGGDRSTREGWKGGLADASVQRDAFAGFLDSAQLLLGKGLMPASQPVIRNCSRLGRSANPPGFSFSDWLRDRRHR